MTHRCYGGDGRRRITLMTLEEIKQALIALSHLRRAGVDDSLMSDLRQSLTPNAPRRITQEELRQKEKELEERIEGFWLIWDAVNRSYGIIPQEE
jgi:hypothetical protein